MVACVYVCGQFQWGVIDDSGIWMMSDTKQIRFNPGGNVAIVSDVLTGRTDVGFARTDTISSFPPSDQAMLKVIKAPVHLSLWRARAPSLDCIPNCTEGAEKPFMLLRLLPSCILTHTQTHT